MTIPSSLFGGSTQSNNNSMNVGGSVQKHQAPAALQMVGIANEPMDASSGTGTALPINFNNSTNLSYFDDTQPNQMMNFISSG